MVQDCGKDMAWHVDGQPKYGLNRKENLATSQGALQAANSVSLSVTGHFLCFFISFE